MNRHIEVLPAKIYYGRKTPGKVVLINGICVFHGDTIEANKFKISIEKQEKKNE